MLDPLFDVITAVLAWFYSLWPSYGMAVAFLTLTTTVAVTPLTLKSTRSTLQMQQHMPELKKLQSQYKGDRQAMNEATAAFYKQHSVNPVGCLLPMLVQMPIFLVMYRVVHGLTRRTTEMGTQLGFTSRRYADAAFGAVPEYAETPVLRGELTFDPDFLSRDTELYVRLSDNVEMVSWGVDLSRSASSAISESIILALPYLLMILVVLVTSLLQQRQIQGRQSAAAMPPQQQMMMKLIPYMLPVFSYAMPAAVVTYFIISNLVRIAQQAYITRSFYRGEDSLGAQIAKQRDATANGGSTEAEAGEPSPKSVTERKGAPTPKRDAATTRGRAPARKRDAATTRGRAPARKRDAATTRDGSPARKRDAATTRDGSPARKRDGGTKRDGSPARKRDGGTKRDGSPARKRDGGTKRDGSPARKRDGGTKRDGSPARKRDGGTKRDGSPARKRDGGTKRDGSPARKGGASEAERPARKGGASEAERPARKGPSSQQRTKGGRTGKAPSRGRSTKRIGGGRTTPPGSGPQRSHQNRSRNKKKRR